MNRRLVVPAIERGDIVPKKEEEQRKLQKYMAKIEASENWRDAGYKDLWNRCYKRFRNHVDKLYDSKGKEIKDRSNISIPYTFVQVETILPRLVETLFAARPYVTVKGREPLDDINSENMETLLDWQMNERMDIQDIFHSGLKRMCIYGTAIGYTGWKLVEKKMIKKKLMPIAEVDPNTGEALLDPETQQPVPVMDEATMTPLNDWQQVETVETLYDDPEVKFIDLGLFYVDPNATDIDDSRYCGHSCFETKSFIQNMHDQGIWKVDWKKIPKESKKNTARNERMNSVGLSMNDDETIHDDENRLYEIHYYWEDDKQVVIINRAYIAKESANPYWHKKKPYVRDVYTEVPDEFYGMGVVEMLEDQQDELNTERNMRIDYRAMAMRRMWKKRKGADINPASLVWRQNGVIEVDDMDDLQEIRTEQLGGDSFTQESTIKQDMQDTSGAQDVIIGSSTSGETATSTMTKDNNASMRFKLIISSIEKRLLVGISRLMIQMNQQFIDSERIFRVAGEDGSQWVQLSPEDIQGEFDLIAAGSSVEPMANKEAFKQRMVELYSIVSKDPFMQQFPIKRRNLLKKVFEAFDVKNTDDLLPTDQELQAMQMSMMASMIPPQGTPAIGGGANTAQQVEPALQVLQGGGG